MTLASLDLWSEDIHVDILTPLAILRSQETLLSRKTQGVLQAEVRTTQGEGIVLHQLDLVAPALRHYRERLLTVTHATGRVYPVKVTAECFALKPRYPVFVQPLSQPPQDQRVAATQEEFVELIRAVLRSPEVRASIQSLIARSNEADLSSEVSSARGGAEEAAPTSVPPQEPSMPEQLAE